MGFFRGIESHYTPRAEGLRAVPEALLGLIGTAPIHHCAPEDRSIHALRLIASQEQGRRLFGPDLEPYTIPMGVTINHLEDGPLMMVINVFDPARHYREIGPLPLAFNAQGRAILTVKDWISAEIRDASGATLYEEAKDYLFDRMTGELRRLPGAKFDPNAALTIAGRLGDPSKVTPADIIGGVTMAGLRTGMQLWRTAFQSLGFYPTDLVAPIFETLASVRAALEAIAEQIHAIAHCQMPAGLGVQEALSARGGDGLANVQVSSTRVKLFFPQYRSPCAEGGDRLVPLSLGYAAVFGRTLREHGFWWTGSNQPLRSASGFERPIAFGGEGDEANLLNAAGISTLRANWGGSIHTWGPSTSAFPEQADPVHFDSIRRFYDIVDRRVGLSLLHYIDRPLTPALIEIILGDINGFYDDLIKRGALIAGRCRFNPSDNPPEALAQGQFVTRDDLVPPPPFQRFTRKYRFDRSALLAAFAAA